MPLTKLPFFFGSSIFDTLWPRVDLFGHSPVTIRNAFYCIRRQRPLWVRSCWAGCWTVCPNTTRVALNTPCPGCGGTSLCFWASPSSTPWCTLSPSSPCTKSRTDSKLYSPSSYTKRFPPSLHSHPISCLRFRSSCCPGPGTGLSCLYFH